MITVFRGTAALGWTDSSDTMSQRVLLLREPLRELRNGVKRTVYAADSLDFTARQVFTVGAGVYELTARVRFSDDPQTLIDLISAGSTNTITYWPNLNDPGTTFSLQLIGPLAPTVLGLDPETGVLFGDQEVTLVFRKTDQSAFAGVWENQCLFQYAAGGKLAGATFARTSNAYVTGPGYGVLSSVNAGTARLSWVDTNADGIRETPVLLLEATATNKLAGPEDLTNGAWSRTGTTIPSTNNADPRAGTTACFLREDGTTGQHKMQQTFSTAVAGNTNGVLVFMKPNGRTKALFTLSNSSDSSNQFSATVDLTAGTISATGTSGSGSLIFSKLFVLAGGWYVLQVYGIASTAQTALLWQFNLLNASGTVSYTGDGASGMYVWGCVGTDNQLAGSYWGTGATRNTDSLSFPFAALPQAMTIYVRLVEAGTATVPSRGILAIGNTTPAVQIVSNGSGYFAEHWNGVSNVGTGVLAQPSVGQVVELLLQLSSAGVVTLNQSIAGATPTSTASGALALAQTWNLATLYLGVDRTVAGYGYAGFAQCYIARGILGFQAMRSYAGVP